MAYQPIRMYTAERALLWLVEQNVNYNIHQTTQPGVYEAFLSIVYIKNKQTFLKN